MTVPKPSPLLKTALCQLVSRCHSYRFPGLGADGGGQLSKKILRCFHLIAVLLLAFGSAASAQDELFDPTPMWSAPTVEVAFGLAVGDFDKDGSLDLITVGNEALNVYLSVGGTIPSAPTQTMNAPYGVRGAAIGDIDSDGDLDLVCGGAVYRNTMGILHDAETTGVYTVTPILGDVDRDGDLDLFASGSLYANLGGTFEATPSWRSFRTVAAVGDVNGDGWLDAICNSVQKAYLYINHDGTLDVIPSDSVAVTNTALDGVALGDVNGDGTLDLLHGATHGGASIHVYENGAFSDSAVWNSEWTNGLSDVALADLDGDGDLDIGCAHYGAVAIYLNDAGIRSAPSFVIDEDASVIKFADFDGDNDLDLVAAGLRAASSIHRNLTPIMPRTPSQVVSISEGVYDVTLADLDEDEDLDVVCGTYAGPRVFLSANGRVQGTPAWSYATGVPCRSVAIGDVDRDGHLDLVCGTGTEFAGGKTFLHLGDGHGFGSPSWMSDADRDTEQLQVADIDQDGDLDLICGNGGGRGPDGEVNTLYLNDGTGWPLLPDWTSQDENSTYGIGLADFDGDRDLDLVCGNQNGTENTVQFFDQGAYQAPVPYPRSTYETRALSIGDVDGDGDPDVVFGNSDFWSELPQGEENTLFLTSDGRPPSSAAWSSESSYQTVATLLGDVDGDGDLDFVSGNVGSFEEPHPVEIFENDGGMFSRQASWTSARDGQTSALALGDLDADGDADLIAADTDGSFGIQVYSSARAPAYKWDPVRPTNQLPNNAAHLRRVEIAADSSASNLFRVKLTAIDVESDPIDIIAEYQYVGSPVWYPATFTTNLRAMTTSPVGVEHSILWDTSRLASDRRELVLRLRTIEIPHTVAAIQQIPSYLLPAGTIVPERPEITLSLASVDFGSITLGDTTAVLLDVANRGTTRLDVDSMWFPSSEILTDHPSSFSVAPGRTDTVRLRFAPLKSLTLGGWIEVISNDPLQTAVRVPVTATIHDLTVETTALTQGEETPIGDALVIQVIPDEGVQIERGRVHFRSIGTTMFDQVSLTVVGGAWIGIIPGESVSEVGIEYYVEVENGSVRRTDPVAAPDSLFKQRVAAPRTVKALPRPNSGDRYFGGVAISVAVELEQGALFAQGSLKYRAGGSIGYESVQFAQVEGEPVAFIPAEIVGSTGVQYWVEVETATGVIITDPAAQPESNPHEIQITEARLSEEGVVPPKRYRMISIPLEFDPEANVDLRSVLSDEDEFDRGTLDPSVWRAFRYLPSDSLREYKPDDESFRLAPGRAFWLISKSDQQVDTAPINGQSLPTQPFALVLEPGWNQVGHPFAFPVAWSATTASSGNFSGPWAYDPVVGPDGDFVDHPVTTLEPFRGYFVKNFGASIDTLWIPPIRASADEASALAYNTPMGAPAGVMWNASLRVSSAGVVSRTVVVGVATGSSDAYDDSDLLLPPSPPGELVSAEISNTGWSLRPGAYRRDLKSPHAEGWIWEVIARAPSSAPADIEWGWDPDLEKPAACLLIDLRNDLAISMIDQASYRFLPQGRRGVDHFMVAAGPPSFVNEVRSGLLPLPDSVTLDPASPNPARHFCRIRFGIPVPQIASLSIYELSGRRVTTLMDRLPLQPGFYTRIWDGRNSTGRVVGSGVYFLKLDTPTSSRGERILFVR